MATGVDASGTRVPGRLVSIGTDIWMVDGRCVSFFGFAYPTRSIVVRLPSGGVWLWSPIAYDPELQRQVEAIGPVRHLISPNKLHHLFLGEWQSALPDAQLWGPQSTVARRTDLSFAGALGEQSPAGWDGAFEQFWLRGSPALDEIAFFHRASRTLILADLTQNFSRSFLERHWSWWQRPVAWLSKMVPPWGYAPIDVRLSFLNRSFLRAARQSWRELAPDNVVMAHGDPCLGEGSDYIERAFAWL